MATLFVAGVTVVDFYPIHREQATDNADAYSKSPQLSLPGLEDDRAASPPPPTPNSDQIRMAWTNDRDNFDPFARVEFPIADKLEQVSNARAKFAADSPSPRSAFVEARLSNLFYSHVTLSDGVLNYLECKREICLIKAYAASPVGFSNSIEDAMRADWSGRIFSAHRRPYSVSTNSWTIEYYVGINASDNQ